MGARQPLGLCSDISPCSFQTLRDSFFAIWDLALGSDPFTVVLESANHRFHASIADYRVVFVCILSASRVLHRQEPF